MLVLNGNCETSPTTTVRTRARVARGATIRPDDAAHGSQQQAFDQQLANDLPSAGTHRIADRHFPRTARGAHQQQAGNVHARHQDHQSDHAHHDQEWLPDLIAKRRESFRGVEDRKVRIIEEHVVEVCPRNS